MRSHAKEAAHILKTHDFDDVTKAALIEYFDFAATKYYQLRNAIIVFALILTLGCFAGIGAVDQLSKARHKDSTAQSETACWSGYNGRTVLRALIFSTGTAQVDPSSIKDPELRQLIAQSNQNSTQFFDLAKQLLPLPNCNGHNPQPVGKRVLDLARVPAANRHQ